MITEPMTLSFSLVTDRVTIGLISPSSPIDKETLDNSIAYY